MLAYTTKSSLVVPNDTLGSQTSRNKPISNARKRSSSLLKTMLWSAHLLPLLLLLIGGYVQCSFVPSTPPPVKYSDLYNLNSANGGGGDDDESSGRRETVNCRYDSCPSFEPNQINVHIVPHTHDDVGWLKTVDQYYYGGRKQYDKAGVQFILDSVIPELMKDKSKRFIYVEMSFFTKWWDEQEKPMREIVRRLVNEGRLEFTNGGWCMNDEATVNYQSTIEQMTLGLRFLNSTFGQCGRPKVGWQIDPFGHSSEQASLFAQFGFDGMYFMRIDYQDKFWRTQNKSLDLIWHADRALMGQSGSIFANVFRDQYNEPTGFCFDAYCNDDPIVDNKRSHEYNLELKGQQFIRYIREYAESKLTNHLMIPFGGDFQYTAAGQNFKSLDKLMRYVRTTASDINIFYSTPSCYQFALHKRLRNLNSNKKQREQREEAFAGGLDTVNQSTGGRPPLYLPEKYDDFMPYASSSSVWWSGYFSSRPSTKLIERETANLLQVARMVSLSNLLKQATSGRGGSAMVSVADVEAHESKCLQQLWEVLGDLQHHDAVTGTEKQHVNDDYVRRTFEATSRCAKFIGDAKRTRLNELLSGASSYGELRESSRRFKLDPVYLEDTMFCALLNISQCDALESDVDIRRHVPITVLPNGRQQVAESGRALWGPLKLGGPLPKELETRAVLVTAYNPLARPVLQEDIRLPCIGRCDLERVQVIHLATNETMKLIRLPTPSGVANLPFRDSRTNYEMLFYANLPALGSSIFLVSDQNNDDLVDEEQTYSDSITITDELATATSKNTVRTRRIRSSSSSSRTNSLPRGQRREGLAAEQAVVAGQADGPRYEYFEMAGGFGRSIPQSLRPKHSKRDAQGATGGGQEGAPASSDRVIVKFDMTAGMIVGLKRASDGSMLSITQKFGFYFPTNTHTAPPGAYIFRSNSSSPQLLDRPISFRMYKRQNGALIEIHQKWADWIWQTIRVNARENYIEFDYVIGPVPVGNSPGSGTSNRRPLMGREVVTRYITNLANQGIFFTDSNGRQLLARRKLSAAAEEPEQLGGSFFPVASTMLLRNNEMARNNKSAEAVAVLVDRAQAATSLNEGDLEFLIHRRHLQDDHWGVSEALNEPGEDGRGLVARGKHRLYLKFQESNPSTEGTSGSGSFGQQQQQQQQQQSKRFRPRLVKLAPPPKANLTYERAAAANSNRWPSNQLQSPVDAYLVHDQLLNDLKVEAVKFALRPILTFDRLRVSASEFLELLAGSNNGGGGGESNVAWNAKTDLSLLNTTLPSNVHLLTLQPWSSGPNKLLIRLENLDNPLVLQPFPELKVYSNLLQSYKLSVDRIEAPPSQQTNSVSCADVRRQHLAGDNRVSVNLEYLIKKIRLTNFLELNLGANAKLSEDKRLDWTGEVARDQFHHCEQQSTSPSTIVALSPRQIRTFLASYEFL